MDCDCDSPNVMSFGHQFLRIFSLPFTGLKLFICPWLFHLRCSNTDLYIGTWWIFRQYFPHAILKWNWMCHRFVTMDPIRHEREKGIFISEKKKKRKGIHLLPHMIISVRDQRGQFNERRAHKHTHVRKNQNRMGNHWGDAQGNSRLVGVTSDGTLYNSISRGNQNKNREQQQNKKKDAQKERVWHAWPHIHKTDPSKNGDQNIRAILAPRDKTEEESNRRIDEKWKEKRNQRRKKWICEKTTNWNNLSERHLLASFMTSSALLLDTGATTDEGTVRSTERNDAIRSTRTLPRLRGLIVRPELRLSTPRETAMFFSDVNKREVATRTQYNVIAFAKQFDRVANWT